jgi:two-component system OmpR family response regulator
MHILIAEDDLPLAEGYAQALSHYGYQSTIASDGEAAEAELGVGSFDLVLLDIGLPKIDGLQVLSKLRKMNPELLVLLLTARDAEEDRIRGLDLGADDYLVKPVPTGELAARIRAHLRRSKIGANGQLVHGPLKMDLEAHRATVNDVPIELTKREWLILTTLVKNVGRVVSKQNLLQIAGSGEDQTSYNAVEVYMSRLRTKLESFDLQIRTVRGFGYMVDEINTH